MKIHKPKGLKGVNGKKPIAVPDIVPYLPKTDCFFDSRHWVCETTGGALPFALSTRSSCNSQQFLRIYENDSSRESESAGEV